jgi:catechol-2,3-dioxygenase
LRSRLVQSNKIAADTADVPHFAVAAGLGCGDVDAVLVHVQADVHASARFSHLRNHMPPPLQRLDHIHVFVADRVAAESWYAKVLGFTRMKEFEFWAEGGGPLTLSDMSNTIHIALFERPNEKCRSTIALAANAEDFLGWRSHLAAVLDRPPKVEDHEASWSLYFSDPDGNPYEITSYQHAELASTLR